MTRYYKILFFALCLSLILISGCTKDDNTSSHEDPVQISKITTTYGSGSTVYIEDYIYNSDNELLRIEDSREGEGFQRVSYNNEGKIDSLIYEDEVLQFSRYKVFEYDGDRLIGYSDIHIGGFIGIVKYEKEYKYNGDGRVEEVISINNYSGSMSTSRDEYKWKDGNVEMVKSYGEDGGLDLEFELSYDNKNNFAKNNPILVEQYSIWSNNNVVRSIATDYTGLYDPSCFDCATTYDYASDDYPEFIEYEWGSTVEIKY